MGGGGGRQSSHWVWTKGLGHHYSPRSRVSQSSVKCVRTKNPGRQHRFHSRVHQAFFTLGPDEGARSSIRSSFQRSSGYSLPRLDESPRPSMQSSKKHLSDYSLSGFNERSCLSTPYSNHHSFHPAILRPSLTADKRIGSFAGIDLNWNAHNLAHKDIQSLHSITELPFIWRA